MVLHIKDLMCKDKRCSKCKETKPKDDFNNDDNSPDGKTSRCRKCSTRRKPITDYCEKCKGHSDTVINRICKPCRELRYFSKGVLSALLTKQGDKCAICRRLLTENKILDIDCTIDKPRGFICPDCRDGKSGLRIGIEKYEKNFKKYLARDIVDAIVKKEWRNRNV